MFSSGWWKKSNRNDRRSRSRTWGPRELKPHFEKLEDRWVPSVDVRISDLALAEGNSGLTPFTFSVTLSAPDASAVTVEYATLNNTATVADNDYTAATGTLTFAPGETLKTVVIDVKGDVRAEPDETFYVNLSNPSANATIADARGTGTIENDDPDPVLNISNATVVEGNSGTVNMVFTVTLSAPSGKAITVNYQTLDGPAPNATGGVDYGIDTGSLGFAPDETLKTISIAVIGDTADEDNENFRVNLSGPTNATLGTATGQGTIVDDDGPNITASSPTLAEGDSGTTPFTFTVTLSASSPQTVTVAYQTVDGTATTGDSDYTGVSGTLTFAPGETEKTVVVNVTGDTKYETNETFTFDLISATNAGATLTDGTGTINNDDPVPNVTASSPTVTEGNSGTTPATFTVSLSNPSYQTITVTYATADGTATTADNDYTALSGTLTFNPGVTVQTLVVDVKGDTKFETNETFTLDLVSGSNAGTLNDGTATINNDDVQPTIAITGPSLAEGNSGTTPFTFTVTLTNATYQTVTVNYDTFDGTATTADNDYVALSGALTFNPDETQKTVVVSVNGDTTYESDETFKVNLTSATNTANTDASATGTILNDDAPSIAVNDVTQAEGNSGTTPFTFTVSLQGPTTQAVTVEYTTTNGTATAGEDYTTISGTLTFAAGETAKTVVVNVNGDTKFEVDETFTFDLSNATNTSNATDQGVGTITNDDSQPNITVGNVSANEGDSGTTAFTFTVTLSNESYQTVSVDYATADGTATTGDSDYASASGTLNFAPGETVKTVVVNVNGDTKREADETFTVGLSNANHAGTLTGGTGTILNDDPLPTVAINNVSGAETNSGTTPFTFTVTLSNASSSTVTVDYTTANATATTADNDYQTASGTLTFNPGETEKTIVVNVVGDTRYENDETFKVNLSNATNTANTAASGTGTITNDDTAPTIAIDSPTLNEGNSGTTPVTFSVTLSAASGLTTTVEYTTADGTATTADSDYSAASGTLTFAPDETVKTIVINANGDVKYENDETFKVNLSNATNTANTTASGTATLVNDDAQPDVTAGGVAAAEGHSGQTPFTFTVTLSNPSFQTITVTYQTVDGTATTADSDYATTTGTITFAPNQTSQTVIVNVNGDTKFETNETFTLDLISASGTTGTLTDGTGTINNDDTQPNITVGNVSANEGDSGTTAFTFTVTLSNASYQTVSVDYATANGTATTGDSDYALASGTLNFAPDETVKTVVVNVNGDTKREADETFTVGLSNANNAGTLTNGTGTILNDDPLPTVAINNVTAAETNSGTTVFTFTVTLTNPSDQPITVDFATFDGTATTADNDYVASSGTLTFAAGETVKTVTVTVNGDTKFEADETFTVNLTNASNTANTSATGTGTIQNDDTRPNVTSGNVTLAEGQSGQTPFTFIVTLSNASDETVTVVYQTDDGTATTADNDYASTSGTITFAPGQTSQTVVVNVNGDTKYETNETFTLNLVSAVNSGGTLTDGTGTINNDDTQPNITVGNVSANEGDSGTTAFTFTVTLSNASYQTVSVDYLTANGTATTGDSDYASASGTLNFAPDETVKTVVVNVNGDTKREADETFTVGLSNANNAGTLTGGTGTILNDDPLPTVAIGNVSANEGNSGTTVFTFTVTLSNPSDQPITVDFATFDGTATTADSDYTGTSGTLTFAAGQTSQTITVNVTGDTKTEGDETFTVNLTNAINTANTSATGTGTIVNDDPLPTVAINNVTAAETNSGTTTFTFTVTLSNPSDQAITVDFATFDGTATTADNDYVASSGTLTFAAGETVKTVTVTVNGDTKFETDETFTVNLTNASNTANTSATGTGTIQNDDTQPTYTIGDVTANEGNSGSTPFTFTVTLSNASYQTVTIEYATFDGTATTGDSDYTAASGTITFAPDQTVQTIVVNVTGDTKYETNETFTVNLTNAVNSPTASATATGTITNDDPQPTVSIGDVSQAEGNVGITAMVFTISLSNASYQQITVNYATADGTALLADNDYVPASGQVTFAPGTTTATVTVYALGDTAYEADDTFHVNLSGPNNATLGDAQGDGVIVNDDAPPTVSVADVARFEGNSGTTDFTFTVRLSNASYQPVTVEYTTADNTATAADDYTAVSGTLTFAPGETAKPVVVTVSGDTKYELDELFFLNLANASGATFANDQAIGTIRNDDALPTVDATSVSANEGDSGTTPFTFTLTLTNPSYQAIVVSYATADGSATTADNDYTGLSGAVTFAPGETVKTVIVNVTGDTTFEGDESFNFNLTGVSNANQGTSATGTILDDDGQPTVNAQDASTAEGNSGTTPLTFTVALTHASTQTITVAYTTADGSAIAGDDYTGVSGTLTFLPLQTVQTVVVDVTGDTTYENDETFQLNLTGFSNVTGGTNATGTITNDDAVPTISVNNVSANEGNSGTTDFTFTVSLSNPTIQTVTVDYTTIDSTALAGDDYIAVNGALTFAPGETAKTVVVTVNGDETHEADDVFLFNLANATNTQNASFEATGTIVNDDAQPTISIFDASVNEGNSGTTPAPLVVLLSNPSYQTITVVYSTADDTATLADSDYVALTGTLTFLPGETFQQFSVDVNGDLSYEADEQFFVNLSGASQATIADGQATVTIFNDDPVPTVDVSDFTAAEGDSGTTPFTFTFTLSNPSGSAIEVAYATQASSAISPEDYTALSGTLTFAPGETVKTVVVDVNGDTKFETDESFTMTITGVTGANAGTNGTGTIQNDDSQPTVSVGDATANEGNSGTTPFTFTVSLTNPSYETIIIGYTTADDTATLADSDYGALSGTLTFLPGETAKTVVVDVNGDTTFEPDETFQFNLPFGINVLGGDTNAVGTITNDDAQPSITVSDVSAAEGDSGPTLFTFTVSLSNASYQEITVAYATFDGTATTADNDYNAASGTLTFTPGETAQTVVVTVNGDTISELDETFSVNLSSPQNATLGTPSSGTGTILTDDFSPDIAITGATASEGDSGTTLFTFTVTLSGPSALSVTVDYQTYDGTATTADGDYVGASGVVSFAPTQTVQTIIISVNGDTKFEGDEAFSVNLANPVNGILTGTGAATGTILNDDSRPTFAVNDVTANEGDSGTTAFDFTVSLSNASDETITVTYATTDGTATTADGDYAGLSGTLTFLPGQTSQTVTVQVNGDTKFELDESFTLDLTAVNTSNTNATVTGTILNDDSRPTVSVGDATANEGNSGTTPFTFTVSLTNPSYQTIIVGYETADGTATVADSDYVALSGTLTFLPGETAKTVVVDVNGDTTFEPDETFQFNLPFGINVLGGDGWGIGTITNDDAQPSITVSDVSAAEGDSGTTAFDFLVTLSNATYQTVTVAYQTTDGTATTADGDYQALSGTLTFAPGETAKTVTILVNGDTKFEADQTFQLELSGATNTQNSSASATGTIVNDDSRPTITINGVTAAEGNSGLTPFAFDVTLSNASDEVITVRFGTFDGSATTADNDYQAATGTLTFAPGTTTATAVVNVVGDTKFEPAETFTVVLSSPTNATIGGSGSATGTISNDDATPTITVADVSANEGNSGTTPFTFTLTLSNPSSSNITVAYTTVDGSARTADNDYQARSGTVTIAANTTSATVVVNVFGDTKTEPDEFFRVNLSSPVGAVLGTTSATGTIVNDDNVPTININPTSGNEGNAGTTPFAFLVTLTNPSSQTITVPYTTADNTATVADNDYQALEGTLTFLPGETSKTIVVNVVGDTTFEFDENFRVNLGTPSAATLGVSSATGTIVNDDARPSASISDTVANEGDSGTTLFTFNVLLSNPSSETVTVGYTTADATALVSDNDYAALSGTLTFAPGQTLQTVVVEVNGDTKFEQDETFKVNLTGVGNGSLGRSSALGTIRNDDARPEVSIDSTEVSEGNSGTTPVTFTVSLTNPSYQDVTVVYTTANGSATTADNDYLPLSGTLTIAAGTTTATLVVNVVGDTKFETDETFSVQLTSAGNATIDGTASTGTATIVNDDTEPTISIGNASVTEGNSGTRLLTFTVRLSNASYQTVSVAYTTTDGTALAADTDYVPAAGVLTFLPNETSKTVVVQVVGDTKFEANETFTVDLTDAVNASIGTGTGTGTIVNDDPRPTVSINSVSLLEGNSGTTPFTFTVSLTNPSDQTITVDYATVDVTATAGTDYTAANGTLTFLPGETTRTVVVNVNGDNTFETNEAFRVNLTNPVNVTAGTVSGIGTIRNDDARPSMSIGNVSANEGNSGTTPFTFTVSLTNPSYQTITVNYTTANGTAATSDSDYSAASGALTFLPGETARTVVVNVNGDTKFETNETFRVNLSGVVNATVAASQATGTIVNDDPLPTVDVSSVTAAEGNSGTTAFTFTVTLSNPSYQAIAVGYATVNGTATTADSDYTGVSGTLTFSPGQTVKTVVVNVTGDTKFETDETFQLNLTSVSNATLGTSSGTGTITNDDTRPTVSASNVSAVEGNSGLKPFAFTVTLSNASSETITVAYATTDGTATAASGDYVPVSGTLTFLPGETSKTVLVNVNGDTRLENDETFQLQLSNVTNATLGSNGTATIQNDDGPPVITVADVALNEGNSGTTPFTFTVRLSAASDTPVTVNYTTANGTATTADSDYTAVSGSLSFAPGETVKTVVVNVTGDTKFETDETFFLNLSGAVGASPESTQATGTIKNDDASPVINAAINFANVTRAEGAAGVQTSMVFTVTLSNPSYQTVTVNYTTQDQPVGTARRAIGGSDYAVTAGAITFSPGQTAATITVAVQGDAFIESDETFLVTLGGANGATLVNNGQPVSTLSATGTILNDDPATQNQRVVAQAYQELLGRDVTVADVTPLANQLDAGAPRSSVYLTLEATTDYRTRQIAQLYQSYLRRAVDTSGLQSALAFLAAGGTYDQLRATILSSPEYYEVQGGGTDDGFLNKLFLDVLRRPIDEGARAFYGNILRTGGLGARTTVALSVVSSPEADGVLINDLYQQYLGRPADASGRAYWVSQLQAGVREETVIANILATDEFFARF